MSFVFIEPPNVRSFEDSVACSRERSALVTRAQHVIEIELHQPVSASRHAAAWMVFSTGGCWDATHYRGCAAFVIEPLSIVILRTWERRVSRRTPRELRLSSLPEP